MVGLMVALKVGLLVWNWAVLKDESKVEPLVESMVEWKAGCWVDTTV